MYGSHYSPTTVSNITEQIEQLVHDFHHQTFKHHQYVCVFLDATYVPLKRGTVEREAVNVAIGIRSDGGKEVLDYSIAPNENGEAWSELLQGIKELGITDVQLFIADGMVGLQKAIYSNFPKAKLQRCWVHVSRNLMSNVRKSDRRAIMADFKLIRQKEQFPNEAALDRFFVTQVMNYNDKFENRSHRGFKSCHDTLDSMF